MAGYLNLKTNHMIEIKLEEESEFVDFVLNKEGRKHVRLAARMFPEGELGGIGQVNNGVHVVYFTSFRPAQAG